MNKNNFWKGLVVGLMIPVIIVALIGLFLANYFGLIGMGNVATFKCTENLTLNINKQKKSQALFSMYDYYSLIVKKDKVEKTIADDYVFVNYSLDRSKEKFNVDYFPQVSKTKNSLKYKILANQKPKELQFHPSSGNPFYWTEMETNLALYLSPKDFTPSEFESVSECLNKNYQRIVNKIALAPVLVYSNLDFWSKEKIPKNSTTSNLQVLSCGKNEKIIIRPDSKVEFWQLVSDKTQNNSQLSSSINKDQFNYDSSEFIGYIDKNNEFVTRKLQLYKPELNFDYTDSNSNENLMTVPDGKFKKLISPENAKNSVEVNNLSKTYILVRKDIAQKLYDQNGPKTDYLQTCKNTDGKTLFDIFKQENN